jgi:ribosome-binding factor A
MSIRVERVAKKVKFLIANALQRELKDPRMGFVTVVRCDLSADYRHCRVHVSVLADNEGEISRVMHMLQDARGFIQRHVAANLSTRATPHLEFVRDTGAERSVDMSALLDELKAERVERGVEGEEDAESADTKGEAEGQDAEEGEAPEASPSGEDLPPETGPGSTA